MTTISYHKGKGLYRKTIGRYTKDDGTTAPRDFWLGSDQITASVTAQALVEFWNMFLVPRKERWNESHEKQARALAHVKIGLALGGVEAAAKRYQELTGQPLSPTTITKPPQVPVVESSTFGAAAQSYVAKMRARRLSNTHVTRAEQVFKQVYPVLPAETPLTQIDEAKLVALVNHFTGRPVSKLTRKPLAVVSVCRVFQYLKALLEDVDGNGWEGPRRWQKLFKVRWDGLMTPQERRRKHAGADTFTYAELKELSSLAKGRIKGFLFLALNTGMNQMELATLLADDIDLRAGMIARLRHKTGVPAQWQLWPETVSLIRPYLAGPNEQGLAFLTDRGRPLVHMGDNRTDSVSLAWSKLMNEVKEKCVPVRRLSFGKIRKTVSTDVLRISGSEFVQQQLLAHTSHSVAGRHYTGAANYKALDDALARYRQELTEAGVLQNVEEDAKRVSKTIVL